MTDYANYAQFGTMTVEGGIVNVELLQGDRGDYLAFDLIHTARGDKHNKGLHQLTISFYSDDSGLLALHRSGWLPLGRRMTVTGKLQDVSEVYTNKDGETQMKKRPQIRLEKVIVPDGALGPCPKREEMPRTTAQVIRSTPVDKQEPAAEKTPTLEPQEF